MLKWPSYEITIPAVAPSTFEFESPAQCSLLHLMCTLKLPKVQPKAKYKPVKARGTKKQTFHEVTQEDTERHRKQGHVNNTG